MLGGVHILYNYYKSSQPRRREQKDWALTQVNEAESGPEPVPGAEVGPEPEPVSSAAAAAASSPLASLAAASAAAEAEGAARRPVTFEEVDACRTCNASFGMFTRRHHCRECGRSYCSDHCGTRMALPRRGHTDPKLVCNSCVRVLEAQISSGGGRYGD